jgi:calcineurin-like phosphoesterase family protein
MKVKLFNKAIGDFNNVYFSSDLHLNHHNIIKFGRNFKDVEEMNKTIIDNINDICQHNDLLVLLGDTLMGNKDYNDFCSKINCNIMILYGNHCNINRFEEVTQPNLLYHGHYLELFINNKQIICSHYPMIHWNNQKDGSFMLHGHNHGYESDILKEIHQCRSMEVGIDCYYEEYGEWKPYSFTQIDEKLKNNKLIDRH